MMEAHRGDGQVASWAKRMALLHPAWLLLATLLPLLVPFTVTSFTGLGVTLVLLYWLVAMWLILGWSYGIYRVARHVSEQRESRCGRDRRWVFWLAAATLLPLPTALVHLPPRVEVLRDVVGGVGALSYFASFWLAAAALVTAEGHPVRYPTNRAVGTFLLVLYSFIGAWYLRPRIRAVLEAPPADEPVRID